MNIFSVCFIDSGFHTLVYRGIKTLKDLFQIFFSTFLYYSTMPPVSMVDNFGSNRTDTLITSSALYHTNIA